MIDADATTVKIAVMRGKTVVANNKEATLLRSGPCARGGASLSAVLVAASDSAQLSEIKADGAHHYGVLVEQDHAFVVVCLSLLQERAFVKRAYAAAGNPGHVPWTTLARGGPVEYLGEHFALSTALSATYLRNPKRAREDDDIQEDDDENTDVVYSLTITGKSLDSFKTALAKMLN